MQEVMGKCKDNAKKNCQTRGRNGNIKKTDDWEGKYDDTEKEK